MIVVDVIRRPAKEKRAVITRSGGKDGDCVWFDLWKFQSGVRVGNRSMFTTLEGAKARALIWLRR